MGCALVGCAPSMLHVYSGARERQREDHAEHDTSSLPTLKGRVHSRWASTPLQKRGLPRSRGPAGSRDNLLCAPPLRCNCGCHPLRFGHRARTARLVPRLPLAWPPYTPPPMATLLPTTTFWQRFCSTPRNNYANNYANDYVNNYVFATRF